MMSGITIVVPVRNRPALLMRCLDSVAMQSWRPLSLIIVDNGSSDRTPEAAARWADYHRCSDFLISLTSQPTPGACPARQKGLHMVQTPLVLFFDSDDTMRPDLVATVMESFRDNPSLQIVAWRCMLHFLDGSSRVTPNPKGNLLDWQLIHSFLRTQGYAVRTDLLRSVGGWKGNLPAWNDWELGVRLLLTHPKVKCLPDVLADIFSQPMSITGTSFSSKSGSWEKSLDAVDSILQSDPRSRHYRRLVLYRRSVLAAHYLREGNPDEAFRLLSSTLASPLLSPLRKVAMKSLFRLTSSGVRGTGRFAPFLF